MRTAESWWIVPAAAVCTLSASPGLAKPADALVEFNQPAEPLGAALRRFASTSGVEIVFDETALPHREAPALLGRMTPSEALRRLLHGTGFIAINGRTGGLIIKAEVVQALPRARADPLPPVQMDPLGIVVTARRREELAIDVPIALTVVSGAQLEQRGARNMADFLQEAPGVGIYDNGKGQSIIEIRGTSTTLGVNENGFYLDDLPFTGVTVPFFPDVRAWDLDRVEVLRGPQGTLFGEGSMGGTVRVLTKGANLDDWEAKGSAFGSNTGGGGANSGIKGALNLPILPGVLAVRIAGTHEHYDGWIDNSDTGKRNINDQTFDTFRAKVRYDPTDRLSITASYWYSNASFPGDGSSASDDGQQSRTSSLATGVEYALYGATARYDLGGAEVFYGFAQNSISLPQSGTFAGGAALSGVDINVQSQELRMASKDGAPLQWTVGAYLRDSERRDMFDFALAGINNITRTTSDTYALFGEATYTLPDSPIDLTAGLRTFHDRLHATEENSGVPSDDGRGAFHALNPRYGLAWHPQPNTIFYASAARGFRSGQLQPTFVTALGASFGLTFPAKLEPDSIWTYELGAKTELWNRRLQLEGAVFHSNWKNVTVREPISNTGINGLINSKGTRTSGIELNLIARPVTGLSLSAGGAYVNATYAGAVPGTEIFDGAPVDDVVKFSANASADYRSWLAVGVEGFVRASWQHSSPRSAASFPTFLPGDTIDRVDARLGLDFQRFSISLFAENLTNDHGATSYRTVTPLTAITNDIVAPRLRPRTIGVETSFRFGG